MNAGGLLAALGALLTSGTGVARQSVDRGQARAARRLRRQRRLERAWYMLTAAEREELRTLQLRRGRLARRMARQRAVEARRDGRTPAATVPLRLGERIPRAARRELLRAEGRAASGRQWKRLRKAARRQEGAA